MTDRSLRDSWPDGQGQPLFAGEPGYDRAVEIDNGRVAVRPSIVVQPRSVEDICGAMAFARKHRVHVTVKGGGHSAAGYCLNSGGLMIDMCRLNAVDVDVRGALIRVQAGARWKDVYRAVEDSGSGLIPVGGGCADVGVAGFVLGGGYSFVSRSYGMGSDNMRALTIVTADGQVLRVGEESTDPADRDLFWACRGGGGGNFGIVVALELRAHRPLRHTMMMAEIRYHCDRVHEVMTIYNEWIEVVPPELAAYGIWRPTPDTDGRMTPMVGFTIVHNGDVDTGRELLLPLLELEPSTTTFRSMSLPRYETNFGAQTTLAGAHAYVRAGVMPPRGWSADAIEVVASYMGVAPSNECFMVWTHAGGRISEIATDASAFPHRGARYIPQVKAVWRHESDAASTIDWAYSFFEDLGRHFVGGYVNYIDPLLVGWAEKYYGSNYDRLVQIKNAWDPGNLFRFQQSIGSDFDFEANLPLDVTPLYRTALEQ